MLLVSTNAKTWQLFFTTNKWNYENVSHSRCISTNNPRAANTAYLNFG